MRPIRTKPSWMHREHGRFLSHYAYWSERERRRVRVGSVTYLPLGSMAVEAGLGGAVAPAFPVVDVEVELEVNHFAVELYESVRVAVHGARRTERGMSVGREDCRWGWDEEEGE